MSALDLDKLERIAKAATRGPWRWGDPDNGERSSVLFGHRSHPIVWLEPSSQWVTAFNDTKYIAANSPDVTLALIARVRDLEALLAASRSAGEGMRALLAAANSQRDAAHAKIHAAEDELSRNGCDCDCDHSDEDHDDGCDRCLACRIAHALGCP